MGNSFASESISTSLMLTSTLPVFKSKFSVPSDLLTTFPEIFTTDSGRVFSSIGKHLSLFSITH